MKIVLDADVLIGALDASDPHHQTARVVFGGWHEQDLPRLISVVNLTEVLVGPASAQRTLRVAREAIAALGVDVHQPTEAVGVEAARLRRRHPISLPDSYCLATAKYIGGTVASFDRKVICAAESERIDRASSM